MRDILFRPKKIIVSINIKYYFLLILILLLLPDLFFSDIDFNKTNTSFEKLKQINNDYIILLFVAVIGPFIETFIFQFLLINMVKAIIGNTRYTFFLSVMIPALLFGFSHYYNRSYIIAASIIGIILSSTYYISQFIRKENGFLIVFLLHGLNNLLAFLTN